MVDNKKIINATIEVRLNSKRLPAKCHLTSHGKTMLKHMIDRVKMSKLVNKIIICTTKNSIDDLIVNDLSDDKVLFYRGSEEDVLDRVTKAILKYKCDVVVGLNGDCPLIDYKIIDELIRVYLKNRFDYISTGVFEKRYPDGFDVQVYDPRILNLINKLKLSDEDREHVTSYIYRSGKFKCHFVEVPKKYFRPDINVTLDTINDYYVISCVLKHFSNKNNYFGIDQIIEFLDKNPNIKNYNSSIKRNYLKNEKS